MKQLAEMLIKVRRKIKYGIGTEEGDSLHISDSLYAPELYNGN